MDRKVVQDGFIVCLRIFCNLKGIFEVCASISHINVTASYESANRLMTCRMFLFCLLCEAC